MTPVPEDALRSYLGDAYATIASFHDLLAQEGVVRGLIGPREVDRLWDRHILNSASVAPFLPAAGSLVDVGTGAGLPGVVLAAMRPDLDVTLLEPMARRTAWLEEVVTALGLDNAEVVRGRAEELIGTRTFTSATARAVAPLDRLAAWTLPLLAVGGTLIALKGEQAEEELTTARDTIGAFGGDSGEVVQAPTIAGADVTMVVRVLRLRDEMPMKQPIRPAGKSARRRQPR